MKNDEHVRLAIGYVEIGKGTLLDQQIEAIEEYCRDNNIKLTYHLPEIEPDPQLQNRSALKQAVRSLAKGRADYIVSAEDIDFGLLRHFLRTRGKDILVASKTQPRASQLSLNSVRRAS